MLDLAPETVREHHIGRSDERVLVRCRPMLISMAYQDRQRRDSQASAIDL